MEQQQTTNETRQVIAKWRCAQCGIEGRIPMPPEFGSGNDLSQQQRWHIGDLASGEHGELSLKRRKKICLWFPEWSLTLVD